MCIRDRGRHRQVGLRFGGRSVDPRDQRHGGGRGACEGEALFCVLRRACRTLFLQLPLGSCRGGARAAASFRLVLSSTRRAVGGGWRESDWESLTRQVLKEMDRKAWRRVSPNGSNFGAAWSLALPGSANLMPWGPAKALLVLAAPTAAQRLLLPRVAQSAPHCRTCRRPSPLGRHGGFLTQPPAYGLSWIEHSYPVRTAARGARKVTFGGCSDFRLVLPQQAKPHAVMISIGRGPIIDEEAMTQMLQDGRLR